MLDTVIILLVTSDGYFIFIALIDGFLERPIIARELIFNCLYQSLCVVFLLAHINSTKANAKIYNYILMLVILLVKYS